MHKFFAALATAFLAASLWAESTTGVHMEAAQRLIRNGRLKDAKMELQVARTLAPEREDIKQLLVAIDPAAAALESTGVTLSRTGETSGAGESLGVVNERMEATLAQARAAYHDSDLNAAAEAWRRALQMDPREAEAGAGLARLAGETYHRDADQPFDQSVADLYDAGLRESRKGHLVEAKKKFDEALALNPMQAQVKMAVANLAHGALQQQAGRDAEQWVIEGQAAAKAADWAKAGSAFQQALKQAPDLKAAKEGLADVRAKGTVLAQKALKAGQNALQQKRWDEAERQFSLALATDPDLAEAQAGKQEALQKSRQAKLGAEQRLEADKLYNSGVEAWGAGDLTLAAARFRDVLKLDAGDVEAQKALESVRHKLDERAGKDREDAARLVEEARGLETRGAPEEALKRYERALAKDPSQAEAAKARARLLAELKAP